MARKCKDTALAVVDALCADYERREALIASRSLCHRVAVELRYYNFKIIDAAAEIIGERDAETIVKEIGSSTGYAGSALFYMSEAYYKEKKREVRLNIARRLYLIE